MEMDFERKNELKSKFYKIFLSKVQTSVIDMVLDGCNYNENLSFQKLSEMCNNKAPAGHDLAANNHGFRSAYDPNANCHGFRPSNDPTAGNQGFRSAYDPNANCHGYRPSHDPTAGNQGFRSAYDPNANCHGFRPSHDPTAGNQDFRSAYDPDANCHGYRPPHDPTADNHGFRYPLHTGFELEQYQRADPSAPAWQSRPPSIQPSINPAFVPKRLYPSLPAKKTIPETYHNRQGSERFVNEDDDDDDDVTVDDLRRALDLHLKLQILRHIVERVEVESSKGRKNAQFHQAQPDFKNEENEGGLMIRNFPKNWPRNDRGATIIPVKHEKRIEIATRFKEIKTIPIDVEIQSIEELCNFNLYEEFLVQKHCIQEQKKPLNECELWYYPRMKDVDHICYQGINFTHDLCASKIGKGKHFFMEASSAHKLRAGDLKAGEIAYMFLCEVNLGQMVKGERDVDYVPIDEKGQSFGSSVDNLHKPQMFIVHEKNNCYPRYMVTYKVKEKTSNANAGI